MSLKVVHINRLPEKPLLILWGTDKGVVDYATGELILYTYDHIDVCFPEDVEVPTVDVFDVLTSGEEEEATWEEVTALVTERYTYP